ncbi:ribosomal protein s21 protein [Curvularia clavata]|uniref:Ribosomal protein s21 protein n=1 Tax=Curvularia clavata TaxID=95742 RepID=A0A9Q8Z1N3_CURCL|nr:ribosomal protein s21 protein [Curvularia clavata]
MYVFTSSKRNISHTKTRDSLRKTSYHPRSDKFANTPAPNQKITDAAGHLQYIPFPVCNETGRPFELFFGVEKDVNCTIDFVTDEFFHLLEFYIHNDAPLSCRIPSKPLPPSVLATQYLVSDSSTQEGALGSQSTSYTPLVVALAGTLQLSHLHVGNHLNLLVHAAPKSVSPGTIDAATAYSLAVGVCGAVVSEYDVAAWLERVWRAYLYEYIGVLFLECRGKCGNLCRVF